MPVRLQVGSRATDDGLAPMTMRVFMKRLADVEVNPQRSNQHEFNAGQLRRELGLGHDRTRGEVEIHFYEEDRAELFAVSGGYTGTSKNGFLSM